MESNHYSAYNTTYGFHPVTIATSTEAEFQQLYGHQLTQFSSTPSRKYYHNSSMNQHVDRNLHYLDSYRTSDNPGQSHNQFTWYSDYAQQQYAGRMELSDFGYDSESVAYAEPNDESLLPVKSQLLISSASPNLCNRGTCHYQQWSTNQNQEKATTGVETRLTRTAKRSCRRDHHREQDKYRTQSLNMAFCRLRDCLPQIPSDTKLTKIRTLRCAIAYIRQLMHLVSQPVQITSSSMTENHKEINHHLLASTLKVAGHLRTAMSYEGIHRSNQFEYQMTSNDSMLSNTKESGYDSMLEK